MPKFWTSFRTRNQDAPKFLVPKDSSPATTKRLANEWTRFGSLQAQTTKVRSFRKRNYLHSPLYVHWQLIHVSFLINISVFDLKAFECELVDRNLYRWRVKIKNNFPEPLATQLVLYASQFDVGDIILEFTFESTYPMVPPKIRLVEPRFLPFAIPSLGAGGVFESALFRDGGEWTPINTIQSCVTEITSKLSAACAGKPESFTFFDVSSRQPYSSAEATSQRTGFVHWYRVMSVDDLGTEMGGKIAMPPSALELISSAQAAEFPLIFELKATISRPSSSPNTSSTGESSSTLALSSAASSSTAATSMSNFNDLSHSAPLDYAPSTSPLAKTYAGVATFDAVEGYVLVPSWILANLGGVSDGDVISVRMVSLPKGDLVSLQPHDPISFLTLEQPKEVLETVLRSYNALQIGDRLNLTFDNHLHTFTVVTTSPASAIDICDTDLKLEISMPEGFDSDVLSNMQKVLDSDHAGSPSDNAIEVPITDKNVSGGTVLDATVTNPLSTPATTAPNSEQCSNCKRQVPKTSIATHEAFCKRNNILCELCGQLIRISDQQAHFDAAHKPVKCVCGESVEMRLLALHKQRDCLHRLQACQFCKLRKKLVDLPAHEDYCGSRTEKCQKCARFITIKDWAEHHRSQCKYPAVPEEPGLFSKIRGYFASATQ